MYGTQTNELKQKLDAGFENDVKMYGTQTICFGWRKVLPFENDVKMYGTQTINTLYITKMGLRMM